MKQKTIVYILQLLIGFQMISAIPAGFYFIYDPTGEGIGMSLTMLKGSPFYSFLIPGLFLLIVLGFFPAIILYGLISKREVPLFQKINVYKNYHWSWSFSYCLGIILIMWVNMQLLFGIGFHIFHFIYSLLGLFIIILVHLPGTKRYYKKT